MARQRHRLAAPASATTRGLLIRRARAAPSRCARARPRASSSRRPAGLAAVIVAHLSRSRNCRWPGVWSISENRSTPAGRRARLGVLDHARRRHLAAQMRQVVGAQQAGRRAAIDQRRRARATCAAAPRHPRFVAADAKRIEHRRDAGGGDLRVIGEHRAAGVPHHLRARQEMEPVQHPAASR